MRCWVFVIALAGCGGGTAGTDDAGDDAPDAEPGGVLEIHRIGRFDDQDRFAFPLALAVQSAADGYGCDYHPNEVTQGKMADALVTKLRALLGW